MSSSSTNSSENITLTQRIGSASIGALLTSFLITPFNVVKVREQAEVGHLEGTAPAEVLKFFD